MQFKKEPVLVDYCVEAMELQLSKLPPQNIDVIVVNLARLIKGEINTLEITMNKYDEKGKIEQVKVPAMSFLRTDIIKKELMSLNIPEAVINGYINRNSVISNVAGRESTNDRRPNDINEVKRFIYQVLKEKYGSAVISNPSSEDIIINAKNNHNGNGDICISLK